MADNPYMTPKAELVERPEHGIQCFERFSTWYVLGLTIITLSIYYIVWLYRRTQILNQLTPNKIGDRFIQVTLLLFSISLLVSVGEVVLEPSPTYVLVSDSLGYLSGIFELVWVFKFRNRLVDDVLEGEDTRSEVGPILTFFFQIFYLQYKINQQLDKLQAVDRTRSDPDNI